MGWLFGIRIGFRVFFVLYYILVGVVGIGVVFIRSFRREVLV